MGERVEEPTPQDAGMASRVRTLLTTLCDPEASFGEAHGAVQALHSELVAVTGIVGIEDLATHGEGTWLPGGKAISPAHAAQCLRETTRPEARGRLL